MRVPTQALGAVGAGILTAVALNIGWIAFNANDRSVASNSLAVCAAPGLAESSRGAVIAAAGQVGLDLIECESSVIPQVEKPGFDPIRPELLAGEEGRIWTDSRDSHPDLLVIVRPAPESPKGLAFAEVTGGVVATGFRCDAGSCYPVEFEWYVASSSTADVVERDLATMLRSALGLATPR